MPPTDPTLDAYFAAWNAHDGAALTGLFAPGGTYEDPTTAGPISAAALPAVLERLRAVFPDLAFDRVSDTGDGPRRVVEWVMRGHNSGPFGPGINATQRPVALTGVDVFDLEPGGIRAVRGYFDQTTLARQLGLMTLVQPHAQGPAQFGYSMRVASGNPRPPGVIALTWLQGVDEDEKGRIRAHARQNVQDFLAEPGFIAIVTGFTGLRGFTVTAWEDEAAMRRALAKHHVVAMNELLGENFVASVWTSVWQPARINRLWLRCPACAALEDLSGDDHPCSRCGAPLPPRPAFW